MILTKEDAEEFLGKLQKFGIKLGLEQTKELFARCGNPQRDLRFIHIAGTNGKGSCGAMLERALRTAGFSTGFYTSPHLIDVVERFRVNGKAISDQEFISLCETLRISVEAMAAEGKQVTYFEFVTVLAALFFACHHVDFVIWETGMGGRFDATNVVEPIAALITNIALDHQQYLGDTIEKIAFEKAGIIKEGKPVFTGVMPPEALAVIEKRAVECQSPLYTPAEEVKNFSVKFLPSGLPVQNFICEKYPVELSLAGPMQRRNFRAVFPLLKYLAGEYDFSLPEALHGLNRTSWPARCQCLTNGVWVDGGHNPDGMIALRETLRELFGKDKSAFIFGGFADKEVPEELEIIIESASEFVFVPLRCNFRKWRPPEELTAYMNRRHPEIPCRTAPDVATALQMLAGASRKVVTGSLYLAGEVLSINNVLDLEQSFADEPYTTGSAG